MAGLFTSPQPRQATYSSRKKKNTRASSLQTDAYLPLNTPRAPLFDPEPPFAYARIHSNGQGPAVLRNFASMEGPGKGGDGRANPKEAPHA